MTEVLGAVILSLCSTVCVLLRYAPFRSVVSARQKRILWLSYGLFSLANLAALIALLFFWGVEGAFMYLRYGMIIYAVLLETVNILVVPGRIREHLFVFGVALTCAYLLMAVPNFLITLVPVLTPTGYLYLILITYLVLLAAAYVPLRKLLCSTVEPFLHLEVSSEYWSTLWFIPIAQFGTRFFFVGGEHNTGGVLQLLSSGFSGLVIILMCLSISEDNKRMRERKTLERQLLEQKVHYGELQTRVEDARKTRHDLKHHLAAILHMAERNDLESLRKYCLDLLDRTESQTQIPYTGNTAADGVLYHYIQRAAQAQIDLQCLGVIRSHGIADMDLCVLLGNALDNAFNGCLTASGKRSIQVISSSEETLLSVVVRNTFDGKVEQGKDGLLSRKRSNACGVGLRSMEAVCRRYGGSMELQWDENTFTLMFILPLTE